MNTSRSGRRPTGSDSETDRPLSRRAALAVSGSLLSASLVGCLGLRERLAAATQPAELSALWSSERTTDYSGNHHQFAATDTVEEPTVVAPHSSLTGGDDCGITALDAAGGSAWHSPIDPDHCTPHAVGDIAVGRRNSGLEAFAGTEAGDVVGFDLVTGAETVRVDALDSIGFTAPVVGDFVRPNTVTAADFEGLMVSLDTNAETVWSHDLDTRISVTPILGPFSGDDQPSLAVAHGRRDDSGVALFGADGEQRWTEPVDATPRSFSAVEDGSEQRLVVGTRAAAVAIEPTGDTRWRVPLEAVVSVGDSAGDQLFVTADDGLIRSLSVDDGSIGWEQSLADGDETRLNAAVVGDPFGDGSPTIAATTYTGSVVLLDTAGEVLGRHDHDEMIYVSPQFADLTGNGSDDLVIMDGHGRLKAFEITAP